MKNLIRMSALCVLLIAAVANIAMSEATGVIIDRTGGVDNVRTTSVCIITLAGEEGQCFIENMSPGDFVWDTIQYHGSGKFLIAEKQNPPELWLFGLGADGRKVAESTNGIAEYTLDAKMPRLYHNVIDENYESSVYLTDFMNIDENDQPVVKQCPGKSPEGLMFDAANQRVIFFAMSDNMMKKYLIAYDPACENELVKFALPDDFTANTITAVLSPDGNSVIYIGFTMGAEIKSGLYLTNIETKETVDLLKDHGDALDPGQPEDFSFSPDGKNIAMLYFTKEAKKHLYILSADGKSMVKAESDEIDYFRGERPVYPSGEFVTTTAMLKGTGNSDVFAFSADGTLKNLTAGSPSFKFAQSISSDGAYMSYISGYDQKLVLYDLKGEKVLGNYSEPGSYAFPKWIAHEK